MERLTNVLDLIALIVQFAGSLMMIRNSPDKKSGGTYISFGKAQFRASKSKEKKLKSGFVVLSIGLLIALVSLFIKDFVIGRM